MDPQAVQAVVTIAVALVGGGGLWEALKFFASLISGRAGRKRDEVDKVWSRYEHERTWRLRLQEDESLRIRVMREAPCIESGLILPPTPEPPRRASTGPSPTVKEVEE